MSSWVLAAIVFACLSVGTFIGIHLRMRLPAHHLNDGSKDVVRVAMSLVAGMAALVLGLLVASAKGSYDSRIAEFNQMSANIVLLDAALEQYGPETADVRSSLRDAAASILQHAWQENGSPSSGSDDRTMSAQNRALYGKIQALTPESDKQTRLLQQALDLSLSIGATHRLLVAQEELSSIPMPFMVILIFWLTILFGSFGLYATPNATTITTVSLCNVSVATAIFLILELDRPFGGILQISSAPLRAAIAQLGQ